MRTVSLRLCDLQKSVIPIGFVDENLHTQVRIDCKKMFDEYPAAIPSLAVCPPEGSTYPGIVTRDGDFVIWDVTASDVASEGKGEIQLTFIVDEIVAKSYVCGIRVARSLNPSGEIPDPVQDWITIANTTLEEVEQALVDIPQTIDEKVSEIIDDTAGTGDTDKAWSADKLTGDFAGKADKNNPVFTGSISMGRKEDAVKKTGNRSVALGYNVSAVGQYANVTGDGTVGLSDSAHVFGEYNVPEAEEWVAGKLYHVGDVKVQYSYIAGQLRTIKYFRCIEEHTSSNNENNDSSKWEFINNGNIKYLEIAGNGSDNSLRSNARTLDWEGNERLKGDLYVECNADSTGGTKVAKITDIPDLAIDDTAGEGDTDKVWSADKTSAEFSDLLNEIANKPEIKDSEETGVDLDVSDPQGYVILRLANGHIQTKEFDSSEVVSDLAGVKEDLDGLSDDLETLTETVGEKITEPATAGTSGQVLGLDGNLDPVWVDQTGGGNNDTEIKTSTETGVDLDISDDDGNVILRLKNGDIQTQKFNSAELKRIGFEYKFSGDDLLLCYGYNQTNDAVIVMNNGRANGLFDFSKFCTKPRNTSLKDVETADLTVVWTSGTDMHGPFQFLAVNNADGYHADAASAGFVGGNHTLDQMGTGFETAESVFVSFFADGVPVSSGYGYANHFEIRWANDVQAYNTVKQGGGGRACLREYHDMVFDGVHFNEKITLKPLEQITMSLWYGLQCVSIGNTYTNISFTDATNKGIFSSSDSSIESGCSVTSGFNAWGNSHRVEMTVDTVVDLGKRTYYSGTKGAFCSNGKGYFFIIGQSLTMNANEMFYLNGSYRFMPNVDE